MSADHTCRGESYAVDCAGKICQCTNMSGGRAVFLVLFDLHACLAAMQSVAEWAGMFNKGQGEARIVMRPVRMSHLPELHRQAPYVSTRTESICGKHSTGR